MAVTLARAHHAEARGSDRGAALLKVGDLLAGKYRVERILGEGGMGVVVAAHHELLDQHVAVKLLYQDVADREAQSRLVLEARACAKLQSEHVARVIDVDTGADGLPFIVMELLQGADLSQIADAQGPLPRWVVVDYVLQALEGLAHAHSRGIVHRDLKPSNLFLTDRADGSQIIKILDFGISKSTEPDYDKSGERRRAMQLTGGRAVLGSPPYMSPEQVRSPKTVDARTDIWALGIVMYELLTNAMPFGGDEMNETFAQILESTPQPIGDIVNGVPDGLERIVMHCLAKNRDDRFADVSELARALLPFGSGTWMQSADRVLATMSRVPDEALSGPRIKGLSQSFDRIPIPSSRGRRLDSAQPVQPELTGTASTVARGSVLATRSRHLLALSGILTLVALLVFAGTAFVQSRARARAEAVEEQGAMQASEPPVEAIPAVPTGTGDGMNDSVIAAQNGAGTPPAASTSTSIVRKMASPPRAPIAAPASDRPRKPAAAPLPVGLPRSRDGK